MSVPSAAASAIAALLSAIAACAGGGVGVGEEPAAAQAGDAQPGRLHGRGGGGQPGPRDVLAPQPDRLDVVPDAQLDRLGHAEPC